MQDLLCIAFTPALQRTLEFDRLDPGEVNRARRVHRSPAGKGVNTALVAHQLGSPARLLGFSGGRNGAWLEEEVTRRGVSCTFLPAGGETRICQTLLDAETGATTELVEEGPNPPPASWEQFNDALAGLLATSSLLAASGKLPPGADENTYAQLARSARAADLPFLLDSWGAPLLAALPEKPALVKMSLRELAGTFGQELPAQDDIPKAAGELLRLGAERVLITAGPESAWLLLPNRTLSFTPPVIRAVNPIGSGDAVTAGTAHGLLTGLDWPDAVRLGIACGTANALTLLPGQVDESWETLVRQVTLRCFDA